MPHLIEQKAIEVVTAKLEALGRDVKPSDNKTFDLIVDGEYAEIKAKGCRYAELDFISLTEKQLHAALKNDYDIYCVFGCLGDDPVIYRISSLDLIRARARKVISYEYDRTQIDKITKTKL